MTSKKNKLREFSYDETLKLMDLESDEVLAEYIFKITRSYNSLIDRIIELENKNKEIAKETEKCCENCKNHECCPE